MGIRGGLSVRKRLQAPFFKFWRAEGNWVRIGNFWKYRGRTPWGTLEKMGIHSPPFYYGAVKFLKYNDQSGFFFSNNWLNGIITREIIDCDSQGEAEIL